MNKKINLILGYLISLISIIFLARVMVLHFEPWVESSERSPLTLITLKIGLIAIISLWLWMLFDFFRNGVKKYKVAWGFCLIFFSYFSALIYFFSQYVPRIKNEIKQRD